MMKQAAWKILFCFNCGEPTPPNEGMKTEIGFICDYCMNTDDLLLSPRFSETSDNH
jgi:hypothetical protein